MGFIGNLFSGKPNQFKATAPTNQFQATAPTNITAPTNQFQAQTPQNQFQAHAAIYDPYNLNQSDYANAIQQSQAQALGGNAQGNATAAQQGQLAQQLFAQSQGQGPSLAQQQLQQATQQSEQQAAGAIASQRGLNPALAARQILSNQANINQQAAGQSAQTRMQEQFAAQQQLAGLLGTQRAQDIGQQQANIGLLGTTGGLQQGNVAQQLQNYYNAQGLNAQGNLQTQALNAQVAGQNPQLSLQAQQLAQLTGGQNAQLGLQALLANQQGNEFAQGLNAQVAQQNANLGLGAQQINAGAAGQNAQFQSGILGGLLGGAGQAATLGLMAKGGEVKKPKKFQEGGTVPFSPLMGADPSQYYIGTPSVTDTQYGYVPGMANAMDATSAPAGPNKFAGLGSQMGGNISKSLQSLGAYSPVGVSGQIGLNALQGGGVVPGSAKVDGDSEENDTVPAKLSPGEIVLPRSVAQDEEAPDKAAQFVAAIKAKKGENANYGHVLHARRSIHERLSQIEKMLGAHR